MIYVTAGILLSDQKVMIAKRKAGKDLAGYWEFPGGKIEEGEGPEVSLAREFKEEFDVEIEVVRPFYENTHSYPKKTVHIISYLVRHVRGDFVLRDHDEIRWIEVQNLLDYQLAPADIPIAERLMGR